MFALPSKEQLSRRQARWAYDISEGSRSTQSTDALPRSSPSTDALLRSAIISPVRDTRDDSKILEKLDIMSKDIETILENLHLKQKIDKNNFIPYFVSEDHIGKDNSTRLVNGHIEMCVEIIGFFPGPPIIYPFGSEKDLDKYKPCLISINVKDTNKILIGNFKRNKDGIYTIQINRTDLGLPLMVTCSFDLIRE